MQSRLVFRSPTLNHIFGNIAFTLSFIILVFSILSRYVSIISTGHKPVILVMLVITGLCFGSIALYILLRTGRVSLNSDRVVEYNRLGFSRTFFYAQIFKVKQGSHADDTWINYYPMDSHGHIDHKSIRGTSLIPVLGEKDLRRELNQRITAPPPALSQTASSIWALLILGVLLVAAIGTVFFLVFTAFGY